MIRFLKFKDNEHRQLSMRIDFLQCIPTFHDLVKTSLANEKCVPTFDNIAKMIPAKAKYIPIFYDLAKTSPTNKSCDPRYS